MSALPLDATDGVLPDVRGAFPALHQTVHGDKPLVYLDTAASSQMCLPAIEAVDHFARNDRANVHRGVHALGQRATSAMEAARASVQRFFNAASEREIVFTRGTTEGINLVANTLGRSFGPDDEIVLTRMEHHSNIVPWQLLQARTGVTIRVAEVDDRGVLDLDSLRAQVNERTRLVGMVHVSNTLGTVNPVREVADIAHAHGALMLVDGAQAAPHVAIDVQALGVDFYAMGAHKAFGPNGIGALYGRLDLLMELPPWHGGGDMIERVSFDGTTFAEPPARFEAGTPNVSGIVGFGAACEWLMAQDRDRLLAHETRLVEACDAVLAETPGVRRIGTAPGKAGACSFVMDGIPGADIGTILDMQGIAVRTGHHCTQPLMDRFGIPGTVRASFGPYNTLDEVEAFAKGLHKVRKMFGGT